MSDIGKMVADLIAAGCEPGVAAAVTTQAFQAGIEAMAQRSRSAAAGARGSRIPAEWSPSPAGLAFAAQHGMEGQTLVDETKRFRDWWTAKAGKDACKLDWDATWRNWVMNWADRHGAGPRNGGGFNGRANGAQASFLAGFAEVAAGAGEHDHIRPRRDSGIPRGRVEFDG